MRDFLIILDYIINIIKDIYGEDEYKNNKIEIPLENNIKSPKLKQKLSYWQVYKLVFVKVFHQVFLFLTIFALIWFFFLLWFDSSKKTIYFQIILYYRRDSSMVEKLISSFLLVFFAIPHFVFVKRFGIILETIKDIIFIVFLYYAFVKTAVFAILCLSYYIFLLFFSFFFGIVFENIKIIKPYMYKYYFKFDYLEYKIVEFFFSKIFYEPSWYSINKKTQIFYVLSTLYYYVVYH